MSTHGEYAISEAKKSADYDVEKAVAPAERAEAPTDAPALAETTSGEAVAPVVEDDESDAASIGHQTNVLSTKKLLVAFPALSVALFVSMIDQTSVSTSIPMISSDLKTGSATSWVGGSFLIASTAFQLINGRLSDIFGRKKCLLTCLALLALGDILCGFSKSKEMLFASRAIAGIGSGGVNSIAMIIVSDITTLEKRGKFQGELLAGVEALLLWLIFCRDPRRCHSTRQRDWTICRRCSCREGHLEMGLLAGADVSGACVAGYLVCSPSAA